MAEIRVKVISSGGEISSVWNTRIEVPDNYRFVNGATLSQSQFNELQGMPVADRGLAIVGGAVTRQSGTAQGPKAALADYNILARGGGVPDHLRSQMAARDWHRSQQSTAAGTPFQRFNVHGADDEASQMYTSGMIGIAGGAMSVVGFGVAGLAIRGLGTGIGALAVRMGASQAAGAATKKGVEYAAGAIFGGQYIAEAWKTGGKDFKDSLQGKASDKAGALSTLTGGLWGLTGLPDIPLPAALAKGANTASGILAPALFLGLLPWGRLGKKGGKEGKQEGGKGGDSLLMLHAFGSRFQGASKWLSENVEFKDGKWQPKDQKKKQLFLLPGQKPEQDPDIDTGSESGPVIDYAPDPEAIPDPEWNPDPAIDMAPVPEALAPLPLPQLLPIPAPVQEPAPRPVPGNWNPDPNIEMVPVPPDERDKERAWRRKFFPGVPDENWDGWGNQGIIPRPVPEKPGALAPDPIPAPLPVKPLPPLVPKPDPEEMPVPAPEEKPKPLPPIPKPVPEEIPAPRPGMVPPPEFWNPLPLPGTIPDLEIKPDVMPAPLPGQAPAPNAVPAPGMVPVPAPIMPLPKPELKPDVKPKPEVDPKPKPGLEPVKPKRMRAVKTGVKEGSGDFDDDEENFPGISMRYGNWLPAAPSFHTGQYPLPPYIIKSGRIVYNVD